MTQLDPASGETLRDHLRRAKGLLAEAGWKRGSQRETWVRTGLRVRFGSKVSKKTRIEVVTEGVFTRLILDDPSLDGIAAVLFDEFHERSLDADLGLALARDAQQGLREDMKLLVMSATLDSARNVMTLDTSARIADDTGSTTADHIVLDQSTGDFDARGHVVTTRVADQKADAGAGMARQDMQGVHEIAVPVDEADDRAVHLGHREQQPPRADIDRRPVLARVVPAVPVVAARS